MKLLAVFAFACALALAGQPASAQSGTPAKVAGTIKTASGDTIALAAQGGGMAVLIVGAKTKLALVSRIAISAIRKGSYVGTGAVLGANGSLSAREVTIFPESMRGTGEGFRPWDEGPKSSMTNGTVSTVTGTTDRTMTVTYKGGEKTVTIPGNVPIVTFEAGDKSLLVPGAKIAAFGMKGANGKITASFVAVGKDGLMPPM